MRIVVDLQGCQNGSRLRGIGRYALAITKALLEVGAEHEIWIALTDRFPGAIAPIRRELAGLIPRERIVVFHLPENVHGADTSAAWRSRAAEALREHFLASLRPDVLFLPSLFEGFHDDCVTSIGRQDIPTAVTVHDLIPLLWPETYVSQADERACYNRKLLFLKRADWWLAVSEHSRKEACDLLALPQERVLNTYEAVEDRFQPVAFKPAEAKALLASFGISRPFVMFTSAIEHRKNVDGLIRAFGRLPAEVRRTHQLALIGSADDYTRNHLGEVARQAGVGGDELVFTGRVDDQQLIGLYTLCKLFVFPSFHEGFGLPALEAMACGAPVIGSNVSSLPEVIGLEAALFDPRDVDAMSALIGRVLSDDGFRMELVEHSLKRVRDFSWEATARKALEGFEALHRTRRDAERAPRLGARPRLAYVADLPPVDTASARRAAALLPELGRRYDIELITDQPKVEAPWLTANFPVRSRSWFQANGARFDRIVYDLGTCAGALALMESHPGLVLAETLFAEDTREDLDETGFRAWLCTTQGYDAARLAAAGGRAAAAGAFPLLLPALEAAVGVVLLTERARREALDWFDADTVSGWPALDLSQPSAQAAADALAEALEAAALKGPVAIRERLFAEIGAPCSVAPSEADLVAVVQRLSANVRPLGRPRLFVDVGASLELPRGSRIRRVALEQLAALVRAAGAGWRVEPVYARGDGYRFARAFTAEALRLDVGPLDDEPVRAFAGDLFLSLTAPSAGRLSALSALQDEGVKLLCLLAEEAALPHLAAAPEFGRVLDLWTAQASARDGEGALWLTPSAFASAAVARDAAEPPRGLERLRDAWDAGVEVEALMLGAPGAALTDARGRLMELSLGDETGLEEALDAALARASVDDPIAQRGFNYTVTGHVLGTYSLALINRAVARALDQEHPDRTRLAPYENGPVESLARVPAAERPEMERLLEVSPPSDGFEVAISQHYPLLVPQGAADVRLALFAWEELGVPRATVDTLSTKFDAVLATSRFTAKALIDSGAYGPVTSIGQPPDISAFAELKREPRKPGQPFVFLHVSSAFPRKGVDVLLAAWARAFRKGDAVKLVLKTFPNPHNDVAERLARLRREDPGVAEIELIDRDLGQAELLELYRAADAVVSPSRGEGYNLPALEAMAAGIPLIVTGQGGQLDFCGAREARLLRYRMAVSKSHVAGPHTLWAEPDEDDLVAALRELADPEQRALSLARAARARQAALDAAAPDQWVRRLDDLASVLAHRSGAETPRIAWVSTWDVRCGIAEYSRRLLDHFSAPVRGEMTVVCDVRTSAGRRGGLACTPAWTIGAPPAWTGIADAVAATRAEAVILQHQDGLVPWPELVDLLERFEQDGVLPIVVLHNAAQLPQVDPELREKVALGLRRAARVLVHNLADLNLLLGLGVHDNLALLPHGAARPLRTPEIRELASPDDAPVIGCHGFFLPGKGIDRLIQAFAELRKIWPGAKLRLVNARFPADVSDHEIDRCQGLAHQLGVSEGIEWRTEFLSPEEISHLLEGCDLIVMAYEPRTDSASGAIRVALSSLTPVAATRVAIFEEMGEAVGWLDSSEPAEMADSIAGLLRDASRRREIQAHAADWLAAHDWGVVAARLEGMARGLVEAHRLEAALAAEAERRAPAQPALRAISRKDAQT
jgi:glycosyltransferase involved in cell wall biosynthesis